MVSNIRGLLCDEKGSALIEYALTASLVSLAMLAGVQFITSQLGVTINTLSDTLNTNEVTGY